MKNPFFKIVFLVFTMSLGPSEVRSQDFIVPIIEIQSEDPGNFIDDEALFKTEKVNRRKIEDSTRTSLFEILQDQPGVDTQVYCANCGAKRLSINGLKAEHTSILVDGIPLHSAISSFYGVDNIPSSALKEISLMRGTGASLTNPEAIGGTINLLTIDPLEFHNQFTLSGGLNDKAEIQQHYQQFTLGYTNDQKSLGFVLSGQYSDTENWDEDSNNVAELPERENFGGMFKTRYLLGKKNDFTFRVAHNKLTILGGAVNPTKPSTVIETSATQADFEDGNVEKKYIGDPSRLVDWVSTERTEYALTWLYLLDASETIDFKTGFARNKQKAIYQHGFDYSNIDNLFVSDVNYQKALESGSILKTGLFFKDQRLRSSSVTLFDEGDIPADSFDYWSLAAYASASFFWDNFELDLAFRFETIDMNWRELSNQINDEVFVPRLQMRHNLTEHLTQRLSYGLGYRSPLTFFESQHGNNEYGYEVDITEIEKAHSIVYSLSYNTPQGYITGGLHYTFLKQMAFGFEEFDQPIKYRNTDEDYKIIVSDLLLGYKPLKNWLLELALEHFDYEDGYANKLPTAAIEQRITLTSQYDAQNWSSNIQFTLVPSRSLSRYSRYTQHYVNRNEALEPTLDSSLIKKWQEAPTFFTVNTTFDYKLLHHQTISLKIENLFDYTQTSDGDSPSMWHWHFKHAHYDGLHTWGPNSGRVVTLSYNHKFH